MNGIGDLKKVDFKNIYDNYANLSFIDTSKFYYNIYPKDLDKKLIAGDDLLNFYYDSVLYLHIYAGLYKALFKFNDNNKNNIIAFQNLIKGLTINFINDNPSAVGTTKKEIFQLDTNTNTFTINLYVLQTNWGLTPDGITDGRKCYYDATNAQKYYLILDNILGFLSSTSNDTLSLLSSDKLYNQDITALTFNKDKFQLPGIKNELSKKYSVNDKYDDTNRYNKLLNVLNEIFQQPHENILGYLFYYRIYYHIILYNCTIQYKIREKYLNVATATANNLNLPYVRTLSGGDTNFITATAGMNAFTNDIKQKFNDMKTNIQTIQNNYFKFSDNDFIKDKYKYTLKIANLNKLKDEYTKIQDTLNRVAKNYNQYLVNYSSIKSYATYIVLLLIFLIIAIIVVSLLPNFNNTFKNYFYLIAFVVLSFITYIYYNNYKFINLYERFTNIASVLTGTDVLYNYNDSANYNKTRNHVNIYNDIRPNMNEYNKKIKEIFDLANTNIYTVGNKVFIQDADTYLYKLYIEKTKQNEVNRFKTITLNNSVEIIKKQVIYIFNLILLISFLTIILLLGLLLYINMPFYLNYIIALCTILIIIVIVYFLFTIIQPTRMIANKNYWANVNPSAELIKKL